MLGVLAIIGVLSVGGIAGYRYAMDRITLNKMLRVSELFIFSAREIQYDYEDHKTPYDEAGRKIIEHFCDYYLGGCDAIEVRSMCGGSSCYNFIVADYDGLTFTLIGYRESVPALSLEFFVPKHSGALCSEFFHMVSHLVPELTDDEKAFEIYMNTNYSRKEFDKLIKQCNASSFQGEPGGYAIYFPWEKWKKINFL